MTPILMTATESARGGGREAGFDQDRSKIVAVDGLSVDLLNYQLVDAREVTF